VRAGTERENYRVWAVRAGNGQQPSFVYVGTSLEAVSEATARLRVALAVGLPVLVALLAFSTWVLLGRTLRPVEEIRSEVAEIEALALGRRVPVPPTEDEISRLAETMNAMLDRLEAASARQREFVADASHELRSPLSAFRAQLEVALAHPADADWEATARALLADSDRMERIVGDLLYLARTDALPPEPSETLVDLDDIVLDEVNRVRVHARVQIDTAQVSAAPVRGNGEELRRLIRNLLDNAVRHARSSVRVELVTVGDEVVLAVEDDGPGVPSEQRTRIFERFVRLDDARSSRQGGTGLGLAIVHAIAARHGGRVALEPSADGARLVVRLVASA
jgi:signal transduction histidine kinase